MVHTRLAAVRSKKYILPTKDNLNNSSIIDEHNDNDDAASNIVIDNANIEVIVPETQTQIIYATQQGSTGLVDDKDKLPKDCCKAPELEKLPCRLQQEKKAHTKHVRSLVLRLLRTRQDLQLHLLFQVELRF